MDLAHFVVVALDRQPLSTSGKMLLQVMSEEQTTGFSTEPAGTNLLRIASLGTDPWMVRKFRGTIRFKRPDAAQLKVTALDLNGYPAKRQGSANPVRLEPTTVYYLIQN
jgi:hypothetical protein